MNTRWVTSRRRQKGLAAVELTIVMPLLLLLMLATIEVGRMLYEYNTLTKAQRNGVRLLATQLNNGQQASLNDCPDVGGTLPDNLITRASNLIVYGSELGGGTAILNGLTPDDVTFCEAAGLNEVQVHVAYQFSPMMFNSLPTFGYGDPIAIDVPLDSSISMRVLGGD